MAYTITKTDGTTLLTLADGKVDQLASSLSLLGRNVNSYGEYYNDNLIGLLENFASTDEPRSPILGQLWYNKIDGRMYVYGINNTFKQIAGTIVSPTQPSVEITKEGDLWINTTSKQLFFSANGTDFVLAGPPINEYTGKNGALVETILERGSNAPVVVVSIYSDNVLLGIISPISFTFKYPQGGTFSMVSAQKGFNLNTSIDGIRFAGTATSADSVVGFSPGSALQRDVTEHTTGIVSFRNIYGINIGPTDDITISANNAVTNLAVNSLDWDLNVNLNSTALNNYTAMHFDSHNGRVGVFTLNPTVPFEVTGNTIITGNLTVIGETSFVSSTNLQISDKNIELAANNTTDVGADGGGITLHGTTDHTITWNNDSTGWNVNDSFNIPSTSTYKVGGISVITSASLSVAISSAPGLTSVGTLSQLTVTNVLLKGNTISAIGADQTLFLTGSGVGSVDVSNNRITSLADPTANSDASTKQYVDDSIRIIGARTAAMSIDVTGMSNPDQDIIPYIDSMFPITNPGSPEFDLPDGVRIKVLCMKYTFTIPEQVLDIRTSNIQVDQNSQQSAVTVVRTAAGVLPAITSTSTNPMSYVVDRRVRTYLSMTRNGTREWVFQS